MLGPGAWPGPGDAFTMSNRQGVGLSVDIDAMLASGHLQHVEMAAGDILIFPSAASVHVRPSSASSLLFPRHIGGALTRGERFVLSACGSVSEL